MAAHFQAPRDQQAHHTKRHQNHHGHRAVSPPPCDHRRPGQHHRKQRKRPLGTLTQDKPQAKGAKRGRQDCGGGAVHRAEPAGHRAQSIQALIPSRRLCLARHWALEAAALRGHLHSGPHAQPGSHVHVSPQQHWPSLGVTHAQLQDSAHLVHSHLQLFSMVFLLWGLWTFRMALLPRKTKAQPKALHLDTIYFDFGCEDAGKNAKKPLEVVQGLFSGAGNETRTRDIQLGKLTLYQLSYSRPGIRKTATGADGASRPLWGVVSQ